MDLTLIARLRARLEMDEDAFESARGWREFDENAPEDLEDSLEGVEPEVRMEEVDAVSQVARNAIIFAEVSSKEFYAKRLKRPTWPGGASGVTIGIGYDVGHQNAASLKDLWTPLLPAPMVHHLTTAANVRGADAKPLAESLADAGVSVPWDAALIAFENDTLPRYARRTRRAFPNTDALHPHCFGALVSLVYNRGGGMGVDGSDDRRRHMRQIRDALAAGDLDRIPDIFRDMAQLWTTPSNRGVGLRRLAEADLFEAGLEARREEERLSVAAHGPAGFDQPLEGMTAWDAAEQDGDGQYFDEQDGQPLEGAPAWATVAWAADDVSPDYSHIERQARPAKDAAFKFTCDTFKLLLSANGFRPQLFRGRAVFALRGAVLLNDAASETAAEAQMGRPHLLLRDVRPDHRRYRCVIGVCDFERQTVSGFMASTAPCARAVSTYVATQKSGNMMLTGCYGFTIGWHQWSKPGRVPGCLIENGRQKAIIRSEHDFAYDVHDAVLSDRLVGDNLHPGFVDRSADFSSWGCLVVKGSFKPRGRTDGRHSGAWAQFRAALGLAAKGTADHGETLDVTLLTGMEAAIAARALESTSPSEERRALLRLRQGSRGVFVRRLQAQLGVGDDGVFGAKTAQALADHQKKELGWNDGVYSPLLDDQFRWGVFDGAAAADPALESLSPAGAASEMGSAAERRAQLYELGFRAELAARQPEALLEGAAPYDASIYLEGGFVDFVLSGTRILAGIERSLMMFLCSDEPEDREDREKCRTLIYDTASFGADALRSTLVGVLSRIGVPQAICNLAAKLIVDDLLIDRVVEPAVTEFSPVLRARMGDVCSYWLHRRGD